MIVDIYLFKPLDIRYWMQYVPVFSDILHMRYYWHVKMFAILILHTLILHSGDKYRNIAQPYREMPHCK